MRLHIQFYTDIKVTQVLGSACNVWLNEPQILVKSIRFSYLILSLNLSSVQHYNFLLLNEIWSHIGTFWVTWQAFSSSLEYEKLYTELCQLQYGQSPVKYYHKQSRMLFDHWTINHASLSCLYCCMISWGLLWWMCLECIFSQADT